jgi:signal transduction histidine kinase/FixJ family two-component response regulator/HPt (histidine-containing phosphotransfer) domain-containing protein
VENTSQVLLVENSPAEAFHWFQSGPMSQMLADVFARIAVQTDLEELLKVVVDSARKLTSALISCAGAGYANGKFHVSAVSHAESAFNVKFAEKCRNRAAFMDLFDSNESLQLADKELRNHAIGWGLPYDSGSSRNIMGVRLVDAQGRSAGSIVVSSKQGGGEFREEDEAVLRQLASITSLALRLIESRTAAEAAGAAKNRFLTNMSHELRTPMNTILGMTDLALTEELPSMVRDCLETSRDSAEVLLELLDEILDLSRIETGRFKLKSTLFSVHQVVEQVVKAWRVQAREKGLALICHMDQDVPDTLIGDPLRFRQILTNLVNNAIKFTNIGKIAVQVEVRDRTPENVKLEFSVSDTGIGISQEDQDRIFAAFTQADAANARNYGGSGLGLTISRKLVELMNGQLWIESQSNQGSTFHFTVCLKIPQGKACEKTCKTSIPAATTSRRVLRVLLAEDTPANQKLVETLLVKRGHIVEIARNGCQALDFIKRKKYDVALMDIQMPLMDGFQTTAAIRALPDCAKAGLPIIAMTAHALKGDAERCLAEGMDAYVSKPIQRDKFIELVEFMGDSGNNPADPVLKTNDHHTQFQNPMDDPSEAPGSIRTNFPVFDIQDAVNKCFGRYDFFLDMVDGFFREVDETVQLMNEACLQGRVEEVRNAAHRLKNTIIYLGAKPCAAAIMEVESAAKSKDLSALKDTLCDLDLKLEGLKISLLAYRRGNIMRSNIRMQNSGVRILNSK